MADEGKKINPYDVFYHIILFILVAGFVMIAFFRITNTYLYLFNRLFSYCSLGFFAALLTLLMRFSIHMRKNGKKFDLQAWYLVVAVASALICFVICAATDMKNSKLKEKIELPFERTLFLCEVEEKDKTDKVTRVHLDVYSSGPHLARKIGEIDETYFGSRVVRDSSYKVTTDDNERIVYIECNYGVFGDEYVMMRPESDTGSRIFDFKIE